MTAVPLPYRVTTTRPESAGTRTISLQLVAGALPVFDQGRFTMLYAFGVGDIPVSVAGLD
ncbi:hypothetical protein [Streptomyces triculaminicus]|uniref:hypothetical protein n=1 Tax=Streptomyces triculaminicus TaxID=2816232 RepID=UPI0037D67EE0